MSEPVLVFETIASTMFLISDSVVSDFRYGINICRYWSIDFKLDSITND